MKLSLCFSCESWKNNVFISHIQSFYIYLGFDMRVILLTCTVFICTSGLDVPALLALLDEAQSQRLPHLTLLQGSQLGWYLADACVGSRGLLAAALDHATNVSTQHAHLEVQVPPMPLPLAQVTTHIAQQGAPLPPRLYPWFPIYLESFPINRERSTFNQTNGYSSVCGMSTKQPTYVSWVGGPNNRFIWLCMDTNPVAPCGSSSETIASTPRWCDSLSVIKAGGGGGGVPIVPI